MRLLIGIFTLIIFNPSLANALTMNCVPATKTFDASLRLVVENFDSEPKINFYFSAGQAGEKLMGTYSCPQTADKPLVQHLQCKNSQPAVSPVAPLDLIKLNYLTSGEYGFAEVTNPIARGFGTLQCSVDPAKLQVN